MGRSQRHSSQARRTPRWWGAGGKIRHEQEQDTRDQPGALAGGVGGLGLDLLFQPDSDRTLVAIPLLTSLIGLGIAVNSTRGSVRGSEGLEEDLERALLDYRDGGLRVSVPMLMPTLLPFEDGAGIGSGLGVSLELFRAKF